MVEFKAVIADPKSKKAYQRTISGHHANSLIGKKVGDEVDGIFVGLPGYKLEITGGSDKDGFPMRGDLVGSKRWRILTAECVGLHPKERGTRRRKSFRGNQVSPEIVQLNMKITAHGKPVDELLKPGEKK